jgi:hypothetical protein
MKQFEALIGEWHGEGGGSRSNRRWLKPGPCGPFQSIAVVASWAANQLRGD